MALHLGNDLYGAVSPRGKIALEVIDDISSLDEGDSNEVDLHLDCKVNVQPILQEAESETEAHILHWP